jgi:hypothetical protein
MLVRTASLLGLQQFHKERNIPEALLRFALASGVSGMAIFSTK